MKQILTEWRKYIAEEDNLEQNIYSFDYDETLIRLGDLPPEESGKLRLEIGIDNNLVEDHEDSDDSENSEAIAQ